MLNIDYSDNEIIKLVKNNIHEEDDDELLKSKKIE